MANAGRPMIPYPADFGERYREWKEGKLKAVECFEILNLSKATFYRMVIEYERENQLGQYAPPAEEPRLDTEREAAEKEIAEQPEYARKEKELEKSKQKIMKKFLQKVQNRETGA